jgi:hypothetical protein
MMGRREIMADEQDDRYRGSPHDRKHREKATPMKSAREQRLAAHPASVVQRNDRAILCQLPKSISHYDDHE